MAVDWFLIGIGMGAGIAGGLIVLCFPLPVFGGILLGMVAVGWIGLWRLQDHYQKCLEDALEG